MKFLMACAALSLIFVTQAGAESDPEELVDRFFDTYLSEGTSVALDELYSTNEWIMERKRDDVEQLKSQFANLSSLVGEYCGKDLITRKELGKSFVLISYLVRYERQPMRFTFEFYRPRDSWNVFSFSYDDDFDEEIEEAAKIHRLDRMEN
jgi:hypothetical protein